jgi:mucin-6/19
MLAKDMRAKSRERDPGPRGSLLSVEPPAVIALEQRRPRWLIKGNQTRLYRILTEAGASSVKGGSVSGWVAVGMSVSNIGAFLQSAASSWGSVTGQWSSSLAATDSLIGTIGAAESNLGKGLSSIANGQALSRTNNQITAEIQSILTGQTGTTSSSSSSAAAATKAKPAVGTGNVSVSVSTPLSTLGIPQGGSVYFSANGKTTTYTSTGSDTVGDLLSTINTNLPDNAQVTATLNNRGDIVLTSKNTSDQISVNGVYARNIGFAVGNQTFKPTPASKPPASTASTSSSSKSSSTSSSSTAGLRTASSLNASSAASLLAASGASGSLVNLIA